MANSTSMIELQKRWRAFSADRAKAKRAIQALDDADNATIAKLREGIIRRNAEFDEKWRKDKVDLQLARDEAVMQAMSGPMGRPAQAILRELGSNNTVWIYELRARLQALGALPEQTNLNSYTPPEDRVPLEELQSEADAEVSKLLASTQWEYHKHQGVIGWLISKDRSLIKKHGLAGTEYEGDWFVADREHNFMAGSEELFEATSKGEVTRKIKMLESLLDETYTGRIKEVDNPYTS